jgi:DNA-binding MarR family transcriptional regulator
MDAHDFRNEPSREQTLQDMETIRPTDCLYYLISRVTLVATSVLRKALEAAGVPQVRPAYLGALMTLWKEDGLGTVELGRRAGLEPSSMTGLLDRMERDGLLRRRADPHDRRAQRIRLTDAAKRSQRTVLAVVDQTLSKGAKGASDTEVARTKDVLRQFLTNLEEERKGSHG